jgi:hypothetical protein
MNESISFRMYFAAFIAGFIGSLFALWLCLGALPFGNSIKTKTVITQSLVVVDDSGIPIYCNKHTYYISNFAPSPGYFNRIRLATQQDFDDVNSSVEELQSQLSDFEYYIYDLADMHGL